MTSTIEWIPVIRKPLTKEEIKDICYYRNVDEPFGYTYIGEIPKFGEPVLITYEERVDVAYMYVDELFDETYRCFSGSPDYDDGLWADVQDTITAWAHYPKPYSEK